MTAEPRSPQLETLFELAAEQLLESIHGMHIGRVVSYDEAKQSASVQTTVKKAYLAEDETRVPDQIAEYHDVPVWFFGGGKNRVTVPIAAGDYGLIVFSSLSLRRWKQRGGIVDPGIDTRHDINDCVFVPGIHDFGHVPTTAPLDAVVHHVKPGVKLKLGGPTGTQPTFMANSFLDAFSDLVDAIAGATGTGEPAVTAAKATFDGLVATYKTQTTEVK